MKRLVGGRWGQVVIIPVVITSLTVAAVAVTQAGAGGMYLFAVGFLAIALVIKRLSESPE
jgi:hypothetical protein